MTGPAPAARTATRPARGAGGRPAAGAAAAGALLAVLLACGGPAGPPPAPAPPPKAFPTPIFDGLSLGMTRGEATAACPMRPAVTSAGRDLKVWVCRREGRYTAHLTFTGRAAGDTLRRIDVHYGPSDEPADAFIARFEPVYGAPEVRRRQAVINSYGDRAHQQFETIWSDATQYVFLTERVPMPGKRGRPVYYLTIRRKQLAAEGAPTGYVPPPAVDGEGNPIEEEVF